MKALKFKRVFQQGWRNFFRNGWLTFAAVSVLTLSLFIIAMTIAFGVVTHVLVKEAEANMNVSVYFHMDTDTAVIEEIRDSLEGADEIASVQYVSSDEALAQLRMVEGDDKSVDQSLDIIGYNPLLPSLVIRAEDPRQYEHIAAQLKTAHFADMISEINFDRNKDIIDRLSSFVGAVEKIGLSVGAMFVFIAVLITYNSIRLTVYSHRQEYEIMRLVGASNVYIKLPLVFEGMWYGIFAAISTFLLLLLTAQFVSPIVGEAVQQGVALLFLQYSWIFLPALLLAGVLIGTIGGWIAVRKYLRV